MEFSYEQTNMMRQSVEIGKMSADELLNLSEAAISKMSLDDLAMAMNNIRSAGAHLKQGEPGFDARFQKYLDRAAEQIES